MKSSKLTLSGTEKHWDLHRDHFSFVSLRGCYSFGQCSKNQSFKTQHLIPIHCWSRQTQKKDSKRFKKILKIERAFLDFQSFQSFEKSTFSRPNFNHRHLLRNNHQRIFSPHVWCSDVPSLNKQLDSNNINAHINKAKDETCFAFTHEH